jgi:hypothetical protein
MYLIHVFNPFSADPFDSYETGAKLNLINKLFKLNQIRDPTHR